MKVSENTSISMPMRNLISIVITVAIGVWGYFGLVERITRLETSDTLFEADLLKKAQQEPKHLGSMQRGARAMCRPRSGK